MVLEKSILKLQRVMRSLASYAMAAVAASQCETILEDLAPFRWCSLFGSLLCSNAKPIVCCIPVSFTKTSSLQQRGGVGRAVHGRHAFFVGSALIVET